MELSGEHKLLDSESYVIFLEPGFHWTDGKNCIWVEFFIVTLNCIKTEIDFTIFIIVCLFISFISLFFYHIYINPCLNLQLDNIHVIPLCDILKISKMYWGFPNQFIKNFSNEMISLKWLCSIRATQKYLVRVSGLSTLICFVVNSFFHFI